MYLSAIFLTFVCFVFSVFSVLVLKKIWNPVFLCAFIIGIAVILCFTQEDYNQNDFSNAFFCVTIGVVFLLSSFFAAQGFKQNTGIKKRKKNYNQDALFMIELFCLIICVYLLYKQIKLINSFDVSFFRALTDASIRSMLTIRNSLGSSPLLDVFILINFYWSLTIVPLAVKYKVKHAKKMFLAILVIVVLKSIISFSKEGLIVPVVLIMTTILSSYRDFEEVRIFRKYGIYFLLIIISVVAISTIQRGYVTQNFYTSAFTATTGTIFKYITIAIYSLGGLVQNLHVYRYGRMCFRPFFNLLNYLGLGKFIPTVQASYGEGNVYTMFGNMYVDFGYLGVIFLSILFGVLMGAIYCPRRELKLGRISANSIVCMVMLFAFYDFQLIETVYILTIIYGFVVDKLLYNKLYLSNKSQEATVGRKIKRLKIRI